MYAITLNVLFTTTLYYEEHNNLRTRIFNLGAKLYG